MPSFNGLRKGWGQIQTLGGGKNLLLKTQFKKRGLHYTKSQL
jgi:hypothetical protein